MHRHNHRVTTPSSPAASPAGNEPSSAFWLELFFDLVVVAAMVVLATALEEHPTWEGIGVFSVTFAAIWMSWSGVALYVNAADGQVERRTVLAAMAAIAVMAASLLDLEQHSATFAIAFLVCRGVVFGGTLRSGRMFTGWTAVLMGSTLPWIASIWVPTPWKYLLWALGLTADLLALWRNRDGEEVLERLNDRHHRHRPEARAIEAAPLRTHHLSERLGTFVVIVLGESVLQVVRATAETEWSWAMWATACAAFLIIVTVWRQTFAYGFLAVPGARRSQIRLPFAMTTHLVSTGSLVVMAAGLGEILRHPESTVEEPWGWVAAGGLAGYLLMSVLAGARVVESRQWVLRRSGPGALGVVALGALSGFLPAPAFVWLLLLPLGWVVTYRMGSIGAVLRPGRVAPTEAE